ncbi:MAG: putative sugar O-methyltransferase [Deltaproteobacteria bacterium]|nr:putative sugar O-methyltransferase [Deltaproteobacteria bacterium]
MTKSSLGSAIENGKKSLAYRNYLKIRDRVLFMLEEGAGESGLPSDYWKEELAGFNYMLDASPLIIEKLRHHCYHLTGLRDYDYRGHHAHLQGAIEGKLRRLQALDRDNLLVPESLDLGGFGYRIGGALFNLDTLKFYESLIALNKLGLLAQLRSGPFERKVVMEIGAGWGGFAYQFKTLCPSVTYIIVDLPQTLLFSAVYLMTLFPSASTFIYGDQPEDGLYKTCQSYDFIFLPYYYVDRLHFSKLDLAMNMVSFQEMTTEQVRHYVRKAYELGCPIFYSLNRDRSPHNKQLTAVSSILSEYYRITPVEVLDVPYADLKKPSFRRVVKAFTRRLLRRSKLYSKREYRHLIGTRL